MSATAEWTEEIDGSDTTRIFELEENRSLVVKLTHEGVIFDAYDLDEDGNDILVDTVGRMADEWWEYVDGK